MLQNNGSFGAYDVRIGFRAVLDAVNSGRISEERLDESVMRILMFKDKER